MPADLLPAESIALTVALAQVRRGDEPTPNVAAVCVLALARVDGRYDYTADDRVAAVSAPACGAEWSTDFDDTYYRLSARCDQSEAHDKHAGPVTTWSGDRGHRPEGVRVEWPM